MTTFSPSGVRAPADEEEKHPFAEGEPVLEYLPVVDLTLGQVLGFEALVRWSHPTRGLIPPSLLIPWAEEQGKILELSAWIVREACRHAQEWPSRFQVGVNCSPVQLREQDAARAIRDACDDTGMNPDRLMLEVTEKSAADRPAYEELRAISQLGVRLAIDDAGENWQSMEALFRLKVDTIKIDRDFVTHLERGPGLNRGIIEAVTRMAHASGIGVLAEGVENLTQIETLQSLHVDTAQGFYFAPPMSVDKATEMANAAPAVRFAVGDPAAPRAATAPPPPPPPAPAAPGFEDSPAAGTGAAPSGEQAGEQEPLDPQRDEAARGFRLRSKGRRGRKG